MGKTIALTSRDIAVFRCLAQYRFLRSTYLHAFAGGRSVTRFKERLGHLYHEGFLERPTQQWEYAAARYLPAVYELGTKARRVLERDSDNQPDWFATARPGPTRQFMHMLLTCECVASIELATHAAPGLRFIPWPEIAARLPEDTRRSAMPLRIPVPSLAAAIIPDAVFGLQYLSDGKNAYRFFALEIDRGTMPVSRSNGRQTSYAGKLALYREVLSQRIYQRHLGLPNLLVLTVTSNAQHLQSMLRSMADCDVNAAFLFKTFPASAPGGVLSNPDPGLLSEGWQRPELPPLHIGT